MIKENGYAKRQEYNGNKKKLPDLNDFPIRYDGHPKFVKNEIVVTDPVESIVQKLEMLLQTTKGEVIGLPNYGSNLEYYLWSTEVGADVIELDIQQQITQYIPELDSLGYTITVSLFEGDYRDIMQISIVVNGQNYLYLWV